RAQVGLGPAAHRAHLPLAVGPGLAPCAAEGAVEVEGRGLRAPGSLAGRSTGRHAPILPRVAAPARECPARRPLPAGAQAGPLECPRRCCTRHSAARLPDRDAARPPSCGCGPDPTAPRRPTDPKDPLVKHRTLRGVAALTLGAALVLSGCSSEDGSGDETSPSASETDGATSSPEDVAALEAVTVSGDPGAEPTV